LARRGPRLFRRRGIKLTTKSFWKKPEVFDRRGVAVYQIVPVVEEDVDIGVGVKHGGV
jgi:hypothetical protein